MPHNIDTSLLRAFVAAAETGGMTTAARLLNLTQAAVSQQVKRLEEVFGRQLFERDRRGLRLTASGERLLIRARRLLAFNDEVWALMTAPDFKGEVRLGVPHDIVGPYMPPVLRSFDQAWPGVRVSLVVSTTPKLLRALARREIDLTLTTEVDCPPNGETLLQDPLVWVGARPRLQARSTAGIHWRRGLRLPAGCHQCTEPRRARLATGLRSQQYGVTLCNRRGRSRRGAVARLNSAEFA